ncbi:MAG TPA: MoxR family ATPase [Planctomycetota bacterium]|nr:MoxR family ATPase [Planctomycetota bacterium]
MTLTPAEHVARIRTVFDAVGTEVRKAVVGQDAVLEQVLAALLAGGHVLLEGLPGTAKTLLVRALSLAIRARFCRVQFTPDLMPADITGTSIFDPEKRAFEFRPGPIFTDLLLADEINRAPAKTQAALLEAMQERRVTADGTTHRLSGVFTTLATQNPIEFEGTYPLPEAQLDRFMLKILVSYPAPEDERTMLGRYRDGRVLHDVESLQLEARTTTDEIEGFRGSLGLVTTEDSLLSYISAIVKQTRNWGTIAVGASPRAGIALFLVSRALAALRGRAYLIPDDVKSMAPAVLRHRLLLKPEAEIEGVKADQVIRDLLSAVKVPQ